MSNIERTNLHNIVLTPSEVSHSWPHITNCHDRNDCGYSGHELIVWSFTIFSMHLHLKILFKKCHMFNKCVCIKGFVACSMMFCLDVLLVTKVKTQRVMNDCRYKSCGTPTAWIRVGTRGKLMRVECFLSLVRHMDERDIRYTRQHNRPVGNKYTFY